MDPFMCNIGLNTHNFPIDWKLAFKYKILLLKVTISGRFVGKQPHATTENITTTFWLGFHDLSEKCTTIFVVIAAIKAFFLLTETNNQSIGRNWGGKHAF